MIAVTEAKTLIAQHTYTLPPIELPLLDAAGCVLAKDIIAPLDAPPFRQSAMDGYGFAMDTVADFNQIPIMGVVAAGDTQPLVVPAGWAVRIFTGAPVPQGVDTVVMQEHTTRHGDYIACNTSKLSKGNNVRGQGSQIMQGTTAVKAGTRLSPGVVGYLAGIGVAAVSVYPSPKVGVIITGKELVYPGEVLQYGQVYESNSFSIVAALLEGRMEPAFLHHVTDDETAIATAIDRALHTCDVVLITGGVSVGDFDFVSKSLAACEVETVFHKVNQKPGKPLLFGQKEGVLVFGLPGNPSSVLTCFYEYVVPCIRQMTGMSPLLKGVCRMPLAQTAENKTGKTCFLKAKTVGDTVQVLDGQESYKMLAFTDADCLVVLHSDQTYYAAQEEVEVHRLNECWL